MDTLPAASTHSKCERIKYGTAYRRLRISVSPATWIISSIPVSGDRGRRLHPLRDWPAESGVWIGAEGISKRLSQSCRVVSGRSNHRSIDVCRNERERPRSDNRYDVQRHSRRRFCYRGNWAGDISVDRLRLVLDRFESRVVDTAANVSSNNCCVGEHKSRCRASRSSSGARIFYRLASVCGGNLDRRPTLSAVKPSPTGK